MKPVRYEDNPKPVVDCSGDVPLTQQSSAAESDINYIMAKAQAGQDVSGYIRQGGVFGDFTNVPDLRTALLQVQQANALFMSLDAVVRKRFDNDPAKLLDFIADDKNREEAGRLGLLKPVVVDDHLETLKSIDSSLKASGAKKSKSKDDDE